MSKIFDALRKAEREPSPLDAAIQPRVQPSGRHPRRDRIYEREFGTLSNALQSCFPRSKTGRVVLVVGCVEGEGATYVSANLARTLARTSGSPILYLDGNFHDPGLREHFAVADDRGLGDLFRNGNLNELSSMIKTADTSHLYLLGPGRARVSPVAVFDSPGFQSVLDSFRRTFKFVVADGAPLLKHPDGLHLARHVDGVVLVVKQKHLSREVIRKGIEMLGDKAPIVGAVLNRRKFAIPTLVHKIIS